VTNVGVQFAWTRPAVTYSIGGTVSGLDAGKTLQLGLQHSGSLGSTITVTSNGSFAFDPDKVAAGQRTPSASRHSHGPDMLRQQRQRHREFANVTNVAVSLRRPRQRLLGSGTMHGLDGRRLRNRERAWQRESRPARATATFTLPEAFPNGAAYDVGIAAQPAGQACLITRSQGVITGET
jgi:hypothetical protein